MIARAEPVLRPIAKRWIPSEMTTPPVLDPRHETGSVELHYALLINPFYPKDAHASFGKHVLTPTLALTSFAATTPENWRIEYWDENLLHGRPPYRPMPQAVGITVHLTFARRAYELADWYRAGGSESNPARLARALLSGRVLATRRCARLRGWCATVAAHPTGHRAQRAPAAVCGELRERLL